SLRGGQVRHGGSPARCRRWHPSDWRAPMEAKRSSLRFALYTRQKRGALTRHILLDHLMRNPFGVRVVGLLQGDLNLFAEPFVMCGRLVRAAQSLGAIRPGMGFAAFGLIVGRVHVEALDSDVLEVVDERFHAAEHPNLSAALGGKRPLGHAVFDQYGPAAR